MKLWPRIPFGEHARLSAPRAFHEANGRRCPGVHRPCERFKPPIAMGAANLDDGFGFAMPMALEAASAHGKLQWVAHSLAHLTGALHHVASGSLPSSRGPTAKPHRIFRATVLPTAAACCAALASNKTVFGRGLIHVNGAVCRSQQRLCGGIH